MDSRPLPEPVPGATSPSKAPEHLGCPDRSGGRSGQMRYPGGVAAPRRERPPAERSIPSVKRSFATSARAHAPPTSSRASSGSRRSRSPITSPTLLARSGGRLSGYAWSRPSVWTAASSSGSGPASTGPRPAPFAGISTSDPRASPSSRPEPDLRSSWPQEYQPFEHPRFRLQAALIPLLFDASRLTRADFLARQPGRIL